MVQISGKINLSLLWRIIANLASHLCGLFLLSNSELLPAPSDSPSRSSFSPPSLSADLTHPLTAPQIRLISKTRSSTTSSQRLRLKNHNVLSVLPAP